MNTNELITAPALEPVSLTEVKSHLRLSSDTTEDVYLGTLITAARQYCEQETRRAFVTQTWDLSMDSWSRPTNSDDWWDGVREGAVSSLNGSVEDGIIQLPLLPVVSITSLTTYDTADSPTVVSPSSYILDRVSGRLIRKDNAVWPSAIRSHKGIIVRYAAGYGPAATDVPMALRMAILQLIAHWYENREYVMALNGMLAVPVALHVTSVLRKYKAARL